MTVSTRKPGSSLTTQTGLDHGGNLDPSRAAAGLARWRRALSEASGGDPGGVLDEPRNKLVLLKIFGSTSRLAELCLKSPVAAADALISGPSNVIAQAARDLAALEGGIGGADALHDALSPLKVRVDIGIGIAELSGAWAANEAAAARTDFAERLVQTTLSWLLRACVNRGELSLDLTGSERTGVFALAGGDFAHEDLAPFGPLDLVVLYDPSKFDAQAARMAERAFVRLGAELKEVFEGKADDYYLFAMQAPLGSGLQGAGFVESLPRAQVTLENEQESSFRSFLASARVVAGDRQAGGAFLERAEAIIWAGDANIPALISDQADDDPRKYFRQLTDVLRLGLGRARPVFRTGSARKVLESAGQSGILPQPLCARLIAGDEFTQSYIARLQIMKGRAAQVPAGPDEQSAIAALCGFSSYEAFQQVLAGVVSDAKNAFPLLKDGPRAEFEHYKPGNENPDDVDKLEDLGFSDGTVLSQLVDGWAGLAACENDRRFATIAPGLLTAFGETQHPNQAIALFDNVMRFADRNKKILALAGDEGDRRSSFVDAIGCFSAPTEPLTQSEEGVNALLARAGVEAPQDSAEWMNRNPLPAGDQDVEAIKQWRRDNIARIAKSAAYGEISFDTAANALGAIHEATLQACFAAITNDGDEHGLTLHLFDGPATGLPGVKSPIGFVATNGASDAAEQAARAFIDVLDGLDEGVFALAPEVSHRPGGVSGPLAPDAAAMKSYIQSEAVSHDQILLSRARTIAGSDEAQEKSAEILRCAVANPKRADILFRDLDRARAQKMRRDRAVSEWDIERIDGGLNDVELIISTLIYRYAGVHPSIQSAGIDEALDHLSRSSCVPEDVVGSLKTARAFWLRLSVAKRLARWQDPQYEPVRPRFAYLLASAAEVEKFSQVRPLIRGYADEVNRLYGQLVLGRPVSTLAVNA